jgi:hypothetical protein
LTVVASFTAEASYTAVSAIIGIGVEVDAGAGADVLTGGASKEALAVGADLAGGAFDTTGATIVEVAFGIDADAITISQAG